MHLHAWHADPLTPDQAQQRLDDIRAAQQRAYLQGDDGFPLQVQEMIALYWLGHDIAGDYAKLQRTGTDPQHRALLELSYGQLLMSRKRRGALHHLQTGLRLAAALLAADDYLRILRDHELLAHLPLSEAGAPPQDRTTLLSEAAAIRALRGAGPPPPADPRDTLG